MWGGGGGGGRGGGGLCVRLSFSSKFVVCGHCVVTLPLIINETRKITLIAANFNAGVLFHLPNQLMVSVDVKHHVYLLTYFLCCFLRFDLKTKQSNQSKQTKTKHKHRRGTQMHSRYKHVKNMQGRFILFKFRTDYYFLSLTPIPSPPSPRP